MMKDTERIHEIERIVGEWQGEQVCLYAVHMTDPRDVARRLLDCATEVNRDDPACKSSDLTRMTTHAAAGVEDDASAQCAQVDRLEVVLKIRFARVTPVVEMRPFVSKAGLGSLSGFALELVDESRNSANDRNPALTRSAPQRVFI
jgi:hypothetical protein